MKAWIQKHSIGLTRIPVIAVMGMIFLFSSQTGSQSGAMSGGITAWFLGIVVPDFGNLPAQEQEIWLAGVGLFIRKMAHFSEYALLGFSLILHIRQLQKKIRVHLPWLWAWGIGTLYAASDEFHQGFVAGRGPSVWDVMIDSAGVIAGVGLLLLIALWAKKRKATCRIPEKIKSY